MARAGSYRAEQRILREEVLVARGSFKEKQTDLERSGTCFPRENQRRAGKIRRAPRSVKNQIRERLKVELGPAANHAPLEN